MRMTVILIVTGALGTIFQHLERGLEESKMGERIENMQTTALLTRLAVTQTSLKNHQLTIFTNPSARAGYDTRSIFKRSLTGLNSEFSFS